MQRGDKRQPPRRGHRARQQRAHGMGNGVVDVQQIKRFGLEHFQHFGRERQRVRRMVEERIGSDFHLVKGNVRVAEIHADRRRITDEMNIVAARGKLLAQFGGDHAGTAICWIAGNADTHETA